MRHPGIERLMRSVVSRSGEHGKRFWQLRLTPGELAPLRRSVLSVATACNQALGWCTFRECLQGHDMSMVDFRVLEYWGSGNRVVANASDRQKWSKHGVRKLMRKSGLSQKTLYAILRGLSARAIQLINCFRAASERTRLPKSDFSGWHTIISKLPAIGRASPGAPPPPESESRQAPHPDERWLLYAPSGRGGSNVMLVENFDLDSGIQ
jgi:hypothetical protein